MLMIIRVNGLSATTKEYHGILYPLTWRGLIRVMSHMEIYEDWRTDDSVDMRIPSCTLQHTSQKEGDPYVQIPIVTNMGEARNVIVVKSARAVIAIDGSYGTLTEIAHALCNGIPVIGLNTWALSRRGQTDNAIIPVESPAEAVSTAIGLIGNRCYD